MKKLLVIMSALLFCSAVTAQINKVKSELKSYLVLSAGPSFPLGDFGSTNENNDYAGYGRTGFNIDLSYAYKIAPNIGIDISGLYGNHSLDKKLTSLLSGAAVDHFQIVAFMPGVYVYQMAGDKAELGFRLRGGYATVNSPQFTYVGEVLVTEDWADAFIWGGGINMKLDVSKRAFVSANLDYLQTRPEFKVTDNTTNETIKAVQHIANLNLNAGFGFRF